MAFVVKYRRGVFFFPPNDRKFFILKKAKKRRGGGGRSRASYDLEVCFMGTQSPHQVVLPLRHSLWRRGNARNVSFETIYGGQFTKLMIPNYLVLWMNDSRQEHEDCSGLQRRKTRLLWLMELYCCLLLHRKRYQSKVLVVHSKAARCSFWGPLPCYDRRSPW